MEKETTTAGDFSIKINRDLNVQLPLAVGVKPERMEAFKDNLLQAAKETAEPNKGMVSMLDAIEAMTTKCQTKEELFYVGVFMGRETESKQNKARNILEVLLSARG